MGALTDVLLSKTGSIFADDKPIPADSESEESEAGVPDDLKLAAFELLEAIDGPREERAVKVAKALKAFFLIVDAQPHAEGGQE
jgi:hypothetical protein